MLSDLPNIGKELENRLKKSGVENEEQLEQLGTEQAFIRVKTVFPDTCICSLYAIEGALTNIRWHNLPADRKKNLLQFYQQLK